MIITINITKVEITGYKSIKSPITVRFCDGLPTVLIGKNGSGKTNILEALEAIASANGNGWFPSKEAKFSYKIWIHLSESEFKAIFPDKEYNAEECDLIASNGKDGLKIDRISSPFLVPLLKEEIKDIRCIAEDLRKALDSYQKQVTKISHPDDENRLICYSELSDTKGKTTNYNEIKWRVERFIIDTVKEINTFTSALAEDEDTLIIKNGMNLFIPDDLTFKLKYKQPDLASFEQKYISINEDGIKQEIEGINKATKESCEKIELLSKQLKERTERLLSATNGKGIWAEQNDEKYYRFIREVQSAFGKECAFLKSENSDVLFRDEQPNGRYYRTDKVEIILKTYLTKVCSEKTIPQNSNLKNLNLTDEEIKSFETYLNEHLPAFEKDMYDHVSVERAGENGLSIYLHENSGEKVDLNMTSAGRRWYFTYYFMKNTLEKGDTFFIDEPAGMLHPTAQKEILKELSELAQNGTRVIYSTHSPYLIPKEWECVNFISMGEEGTEILNTEEEITCVKRVKEITGNDIFNLQEIVERFNRSNRKEVARRCYEELKKKFGTMEKAAEELYISVDTIESWQKKKKGISLENLILTAEKTDVNIMDIL